MKEHLLQKIVPVSVLKKLPDLYVILLMIVILTLVKMEELAMT